jgi:glycine/D-amino acid oxidase-like deaminating enzyme
VSDRTRARSELRACPFDRSRAWAGLYEMSPDSHAIVGRVGDWVYANDRAGTASCSPAIGQIVSEIIVDGVNRGPNCAHPVRRRAADTTASNLL